MRACIRATGFRLMLFSTVLLGALPATPASKNDFAALEFLLGNWTGEGGGSPGQATGGFSFAEDLQGAVVVRKSYAEYPATKDKAAYRHDDLMVIYKDTTANRLRAVFFDNEGHTINYSIRAADDGNTIEFLSDLQTLSPRFRLTYQRTGIGTLKLKFETAPAAKPEAFQTYIEAVAHRQKN